METVGYVKRCQLKGNRLGLFRPNGSLSNWFAADDTRDDVAAVLARNGFVLNADDTVSKGE